MRNLSDAGSELTVAVPCTIMCVRHLPNATEKRSTERKQAANCVTPIYSVYLL